MPSQGDLRIAFLVAALSATSAAFAAAPPEVALAKFTEAQTTYEKARTEEKALEKAKKTLRDADDALSSATSDPAQVLKFSQEAEAARASLDSLLLKLRKDLAEGKLFGEPVKALLNSDEDVSNAVAKAVAALGANMRAAGTAYRAACQASPLDCSAATQLSESQFYDLGLVAQQIEFARPKVAELLVAAEDAGKKAVAAEATLRGWLALRKRGVETHPVAPADLVHAQAAREKAKEAGEKATALSKKIQSLSATAVSWSACKVNMPCPGFSATGLTKLAGSSAGLESELKELVAQVNQSRENSYRLDERVTSLNGDAKQQSTVELLSLLDSFPDARSLFGGDAARVSTSAAGAEATVRIDLNKFPGALTRDTRLIVSAAKGDGDQTSLLASRDSKLVFPSVQWVRDWSRGVGDFGSWGQTIFVAGSNVKLGYAEMKYRERANLSEKLSTRRFPWSVGAQMAVAGTEAQRFHLFKVDYATRYEQADVETVCPASPSAGENWLTCVDARFAPPQTQRGWQFGYEWRVVGKHAAVSFGVQYDARTKLKTYSLPIYLVRDGGDDKKPFTAGISLDYKTRSTEAAKRSFEVGVFVGAPFSLFAR